MKNSANALSNIKKGADRNGRKKKKKELSRHQVKDNVVLIDCVTLWCTNFFFF